MKRVILSAEGMTAKQRAELAGTTKDAKELRRLANDNDDWVRIEVAGNSSTPPEALAELADDESYGVRVGVEGNPNTPVTM